MARRASLNRRNSLPTFWQRGSRRDSLGDGGTLGRRPRSSKTWDISAPETARYGLPFGGLRESAFLRFLRRSEACRGSPKGDRPRGGHSKTKRILPGSWGARASDV